VSDSRDESDRLIAAAIIRDGEHRATAARGDTAMPPLVPPKPEATPKQEDLRAELFAIACMAAEMTSAQRIALIADLAATTRIGLASR
jgi:hypothetical protein